MVKAYDILINADQSKVSGEIFNAGYENKTVFFQSGAGIVHDSIPEKEFQETINKAQAIISAAEDSYSGLDI